MLKQIIILVITSCFFLENIVVHIVLGNDAAYYLEDAAENGASEKEDVAKKDKKEDYNINSCLNYYHISDTINQLSHFFEERPYFQYAPEILLPPPDAA